MNRPDALPWRAGTDMGSPATGRAPPHRDVAAEAVATPPAAPPGHAVLLMSRLRRSAVPWALWRLARGATALGPVQGLRFARVLGSGREGGFGLEPGLDCQGVFAAFDTAAQAEAFALHSAAAQAYRERAIEQFSMTLAVASCRGSWGGHTMAPAGGPDAIGMPGAVAALTRAAIRPTHMRAFWRHSPPAEADLAAAPGCRLAVGLGEAPLLRQATFSLWDSTQAMEAYARNGAHQRAIRASWAGAYFSEWMFVRFRPLALRGRWQGRELGTGTGLD